MGVAGDVPVVLGIETSCDETGVGIVRGGDLLGQALASSAGEHARFSGVVPEIAARAHVEAMVPMVTQALASAGLTLGDVDAVAVTAGPGLAGALLVGLSAAKAYCLALARPLYAVNHLAAHIAVDTLEHGALPPCVALLVSGGHTSLVSVDGAAGPYEVLGSTVDDAAGEAFDKVARLLGLPFPGGPPVDAAARDGDPTAVVLPRAKAGDGSWDFSFSGVKTAVARYVEANAGLRVADVAASFQEAVADILSAKAVAAAVDRGVDTLLLGGGVAANSRLRALTATRAGAAGLSLRVPRPQLCTDNGAMVAALGSLLLQAGVPASSPDVGVDPGAVLAGLGVSATGQP